MCVHGSCSSGPCPTRLSIALLAGVPALPYCRLLAHSCLPAVNTHMPLSLVQGAALPAGQRIRAGLKALPLDPKSGYTAWITEAHRIVQAARQGDAAARAALLAH